MGGAGAIKVNTCGINFHNDNASYMDGINFYTMLILYIRVVLANITNIHNCGRDSSCDRTSILLNT